MSRVHRLQSCDRIFFVTVKLQPGAAPLASGECALVVEALAASRRKLCFLLHGYVVMPDHWHALIWSGFPSTISRVVQNVK